MTEQTATEAHTEYYRTLTVAQLIEHTAQWVRLGETSPSLATAHLDAMAAEQHHRCVASVSVARSLARREAAARPTEQSTYLSYTDAELAATAESHHDAYLSAIAQSARLGIGEPDYYLAALHGAALEINRRHDAAVSWALHYREMDADYLIARTWHLEQAQRWGIAQDAELRFTALETEQARRSITLADIDDVIALARRVDSLDASKLEGRR